MHRRPASRTPSSQPRDAPARHSAGGPVLHDDAVDIPVASRWEGGLAEVETPRRGGDAAGCTAAAVAAAGFLVHDGPRHAKQIGRLVRQVVGGL